MSIQIPDLLYRVLRSSGLPRDRRLEEWARFVDDVDPDAEGVRVFRGPAIPAGPVTVEHDRPRLVLASTCTRSGERTIRHYRVLVLELDGELTCTDIVDHAATPGWVERIAGPVLDLLASLARTEPDRLEPVQVTLVGHALDDLDRLRILTLGVSDYEIVQDALACYRAELSWQEVER